MRILYATDVHGEGSVYETILRRGKSKDIDAVIIGGDILPTGFSNSYISTQKEFLERYLIPRLNVFRKKYKKDVYVMMGNDDFAVNMNILSEAERKGIIKLLHKKVNKLSNVYIVGYSFVNPIPFLLKDWEKEENEIEKDLEKIGILTNPKKTIYVFHAPPFGTSLDIIHTGLHVGSIAIRNFIEKKQPLLTLHGHIHESFEMSGVFFERIGKTISINPGTKGMVVIDIEKMEMKFIEYGI